MPRRMCRTATLARRTITARLLLSDHSGATSDAADPQGRHPRSAQTEQFLHYRRDRQVVRFVTYDIRCSIEPAFHLLRFDPGIRACQLDRHVRNKDVQGLAIGGAPLPDLEQKFARPFLACPRSEDAAPRPV